MIVENLNEFLLTIFLLMLPFIVIGLSFLIYPIFLFVFIKSIEFLSRVVKNLLK